FPSISAATGGENPGKYIWRICMALYAFPKMCLDINHYLLFKRRRISNYKELSLTFIILNLLTLLSAIIQNMSVLILSMVTSTENYDVHATFFILYLIFSLIHYILYA